MTTEAELAFLQAQREAEQKMAEEAAKKQVEQQPTSQPTTTWKPDFTKSNPYEGMPSEYAEKIYGTQAYESAVNKGWINPIPQPESYKPFATTSQTVSITQPKVTVSSTTSGNIQFINGVPITISGKITEAQKQKAQELAKKIESQNLTTEQKMQAIKPLISNPVMLEEFIKADQRFIDTHTLLADGSYMKNEDFKTLNETEKRLATLVGFEGLKQHWKKYEDPKWSLPSDVREVYEKSNPEDKFSILQSYDVIDNKLEYTGADEKGNPMYRMGIGVNSFVMSKDFSNMVVDIFVPLVYTIRNWNELSVAERAWNITLDALFFVPLLGSAARGAKATTAVTRTERMLGALRGVSNELVMQARAPIDFIMHPIGSMKGGARQAWDSLENVFNMKKLPEAVITTTDSTIRIPIGKNISAADAVIARNKIMAEAAKTGADIVIEMNGTRYTLSRSALMKELGGLSHATPSGEAFIEGVKIKLKPGMSSVEQGLFMSPEALPRFTKSSAFGKTGETPAILITSTDTAQDALQTGKIYKSHTGPVTELEMKFPVGYQVKEPTQVLYTRLGYEKYKTLILLEQPLSKSQILKLKSLALLEDLKAPFKPALLIENTDDYIKGAAKFENVVDEEEIRRLARLLDQSGNRNAARNIRAIYNGIVSAREYVRNQTLVRKGERIGNMTINTTRPVKPYTEPTRETFEVYAEKIGRQKITPPKTEKPLPVRITTKENQEFRPVTPDTFKRTKAEDTRTIERVKPTEEEPEHGYERGYETDRITRYTREIRLPDKDTTRHYMPTSPEYQQKSRKIIKTSNGAIAWRMGKVGKKDRWDVVVNPYTSNEQYYMILGSQPQGATILQRGKGSAYGTTQVVRGTAPKRDVKVDSGIVDITITPTGKKSVKMKVTGDPKQETTGDITIGRNKTPRISIRNRRISPKTPKIR